MDGLLGEYLRHHSTGRAPTRWFECEVPTSIVLPVLAHVYRWADSAVLPSEGRVR